MSEKKYSLRLMNIHVKYDLELSVCLSGYLAVRSWILAVVTITFEEVSGSKRNLVGVLYI